MYLKVCHHCQQEFKHRNHQARYCSTKCKADYNKLNPTPKHINCAQCGKVIHNPTGNQRLCSKECRDLFYQEQLRSVGNWFIFERDDFRCIYCGKSSIEDGVKLNADHIHPASKGGKDEAGNLVTACQKCNGAKLDKFLNQETEERIRLEVDRRNKERGISGLMTIKLAGRQCVGED